MYVSNKKPRDAALGSYFFNFISGLSLRKSPLRFRSVGATKWQALELQVWDNYGHAQGGGCNLS